MRKLSKKKSKRSRKRSRSRSRKRSKSIFKIYKKQKGDKIFKNELYFPRGEKYAITYNKKLNTTLMNLLYSEKKSKKNPSWWDKLWNKNLSWGEFLDKLVTEETSLLNIFEKDNFDLTDQNQADILVLKNIIKRCCREILYDKIRSNKNFVDITMLECMGVSALIIACRLIMDFDWAYDSKWNKQGSKFTKWSSFGYCSKSTLYQMEFDMLETTDWRTCYKVQKRLGIIPHKFDKKKVSRILLSKDLLTKYQEKFDSF